MAALFQHDAEKKGFSESDRAVGPATSFDEDIWSLESVDVALDRKMRLVNDALDEIGMTPYHWKLFCLNGFGYAVDSLILLIQSVIASYAINEFSPGWNRGLTCAVYVGMLLGALVWGFGADIIGRKLAFNVSLLFSAIFTIAAGASPNWIALGSFACLAAFGAGGNLVLDTAVFLEFLPSRKQWLLTLMAAWWGVGQAITGLIAWGFLPDYSCAGPENCPKSENMGWRYVWYTSGALVFVLSILRVTVINLKETPKYLLGQGRDDEVVETLQWMANKYNRPCSLTLGQLEACGDIVTSRAAAGKGNKKVDFSFADIYVHLRGLFLTKKQGLSTLLIWLSWLLIGLAYPLYNVFLPTYLATRGAQFGETSQSVYWRNYLFSNLASIVGPVIAAGLCQVRFLGRRGTMVIGALVTMAFFFAYTSVRSNGQNLGFNIAISCCLNIYYSCLYAYSPEVLPSAHRTTGNGIAVAFNRLMGIMSAVIATYADPATTAPIYICAGLFIVLAVVSALFPFEPYGRRSN